MLKTSKYNLIVEGLWRNKIVIDVWGLEKLFSRIMVTRYLFWKKFETLFLD